jgi:hypothetical protein
MMSGCGGVMVRFSSLLFLGVLLEGIGHGREGEGENLQKQELSSNPVEPP